MQDGLEFRTGHEVIRVLLPEHLKASQSVAATQTTIDRPASPTNVEWSTQDIAVAAVTFVVGSVAVAWAFMLNHKHDKTIKQRMKLDNASSIDRNDSLQ